MHILSMHVEDTWRKWKLSEVALQLRSGRESSGATTKSTVSIFCNDYIQKMKIRNVGGKKGHNNCENIIKNGLSGTALAGVTPI